MSKFHRKLGIVFVLMAFLASCAPLTTPAPAPPAYWPAAEWRRAAPEEQGMDSEMLAQMVENIQQEGLALHSLLIVRNGYLVGELYAYPYSAGQAHWVTSVTKSVISALVGIAIHKGHIKGVREPLSSLLPRQWVKDLDEQKKAITLEQLLTMTSGLDCHENPAPGEPVMQASQDWVQFVLDQPMAAQPGTKFNYCTSAVQLLSAVLQQATGLSAGKFANQELFGPLGIGPITEARWPSDPQGVTVGGYGLTLTPREMARLGYLFLSQGRWDGKMILPASWVAASTSSHANRGDKKEYGYLWWIDPQGKWYAALGRAGEHIFVYPAENLVVVFTAGLPFTNDADLLPLQELLDQYILPAVKSSQPLPANPGSLARLEAGIQALAQPERMAVQPMPAIAAEISGKTYALGDNPFGWQTMIFSFQEGAGEVKITVNGFRQLAVGLDNVFRIFDIDDKDFPQALRGHWESQDTFVVENVVLGQMIHLIYNIQFSGEAIHITGQELYYGSNFDVQGTLSPAAK